MEASSAQRAAPIWRGAVVCALIAALVRLAVILMPPEGLKWGGFVWNEEWLRGNVAHEILNGPIIPLRDHVVGLWGGTVVVGAMATPFFALFGEVLPALRLACLPFPMIEAAAAFALLHRLAGARAAWAGGLMVAIAAPGPIFDSVLAQGTHQHFHALVLAWMWFGSEIRARRSGPLAHGALAASLGLILYFGGSMLIALAVLLDLALDRTMWRDVKILGARVGGFLLGCIPLLFARARSSDTMLGIYGHSPAGLAFGGGEEPWKRFVDLFARHVPETFWIRGPAGYAIGVAWMIALLVLWGYAVWNLRRTRDPAGVTLLAFPVVFAAIWAMSPLVRGDEDYIIALRYMLPLLGVLFMTSALAIERIGRTRPRTANCILGAFLFLGVVTLVPKLEPSAAAENWRTPGSRPAGVARVHLFRHGADLAALDVFLTRIDERRSGAERAAVLRELDELVEAAARARERLRERGAIRSEDPAPWWLALERVREREKAP